MDKGSTFTDGRLICIGVTMYSTSMALLYSSLSFAFDVYR